MKRLNKRFSTVMLIMAGVISLLLGAGLPRIHSFSDNLISGIFPVSYRVEYRDAKSASVVAPVLFVGESAVISYSTGNEVIPVSNAVFTCLDTVLRTQNMIRSSLLSATLAVSLACLPFVLCAAAFVPRRTHRHKGMNAGATRITIRNTNSSRSIPAPGVA